MKPLTFSDEPSWRRLEEEDMPRVLPERDAAAGWWLLAGALFAGASLVVAAGWAAVGAAWWIARKARTNG